MTEPTAVAESGSRGSGAAAEDVDRSALERDAPARHRDQADGRLGERGFATARFTDQADDLAGVDVQAGAGNGGHEGAVPALVHHLYVTQLQQAHRARLATSGSTGHAIWRPSSIRMSGGTAVAQPGSM